MSAAKTTAKGKKPAAKRTKATPKKAEEKPAESLMPRTPPTKTTGGQAAFFSCWDIHAYYGESYIVQGVSFDVREGEIVALLGRNGAGKTSTLRNALVPHMDWPPEHPLQTCPATAPARWRHTRS